MARIKLLFKDQNYCVGSMIQYTNIGEKTVLADNNPRKQFQQMTRNV